MHGGKISVFSDGEGKGSTFTVMMPLVERNECDDVERGESSTDARFHTVIYLMTRKVIPLK
jgi:hypothetical protein